MSRITRTHGLLIAAIAALALSVLAGNAAAVEVEAKPGWESNTRVYPTNLKPGGKGVVVVQVFNTGAGYTKGPVTVTDTLPPGLEAEGEAGALENFGVISNEYVEFLEEIEEEGTDIEQLRVWRCTGTTVVTCKTGPGAGGVERPLRPGFAGRIGIPVNVVGSPGAETNKVVVSGGGASSASERTANVTISPSPAGFGLAGQFDGWFTNADGTPDTQAGSHPYELTLNFAINNARGLVPAGGPLRDLSIKLPPGIVGDPQAVPQCTRQQFMAGVEGGCPPDTQIGVDRPSINPNGEEGHADWGVRLPVYNLVPPPGEPAEFGFDFAGSNILIDFGVRSGSDYGITGTARNLAQQIVYNSITVWGMPAEAVHNYERCGRTNYVEGSACPAPLTGVVPKPLLTLPTACEGPQAAELTIDSWNSSLPPVKETFEFHDQDGVPMGFTGCEHLGFNDSMKIAPDTSFADTPAGLTVDVRVPQEGLSDAESLAISNLKDTTVTLPEGVAINPGQAAGLDACGPDEDGLTTEAERAEGREDNGPAHCPNASRVGTDEIETPLLSKPLKGDVYVMPANPPHIQLLLTAEGEGVDLKLVGNVNLNEKTGQLVTTFANTPELPFTDFKLSFSGGAQAALSTPLTCGTYTTTGDFTPWSAPAVEDLFLNNSFQITAGVGGGACPSAPLPFSPVLTAGSTTDQAGGFTGFSMLLTRADGQQRIGSLQFRTPEGLLGMISKVSLCGEAQANAGTCPASSQIGHTVVEAGPGPYPLVVPEPGQPPAPIYLTEGYKGAPYGLSIVVPLHVGPFTLQTQIVRARIEVDPLTTELTITTDPLPSIVDGVPADLRAIDAVIDRPEFMFNPTGCQPMSFSGTATSLQGTQAPISSHFQMGSCRSLKFKPDFRVSTSAKTSRKNGASLDAKILYPTGKLEANQASSQSNVAYVKVELPKQLPSRLSTLQKACLAATFEANPASCPAASVVGSATAVTPVLPEELTGPAYFVSYGGQKFPELVIELKGYGVSVFLHGETFISKAGITSSTFHQVPDVPITSFELKLPAGPDSALAANTNLCDHSLAMPTVFKGHNGAEIQQDTPIEVKGCSNALSLKAHVKGRKVKAKVYVPAAGKIKLTGKGLTSKTRKANGREQITITLKQRKPGRLRTRLHATYTPTAGKDRKRQTRSVKLKLET